MEKTCVRDIMTSPAIVAPPDMTVQAAVALMKQHRIRHLPVIESGRLVGIISRGDLREASAAAAINADSYELSFMLSRVKVAQLMTRKVYTITADALIVHAVELMNEYRIAALPVVDRSSSVIGVVTESDLLRLLARKLRESEEQPAAK